MIPEKRKNNLSKGLSLLLAISLINQAIFPTAALALTGGPSQPEVQSFEPIGTTQMVDPFSGDFVYNIPLMDVDGYPLNISYHGGITMDQEASWVGLGWNLNVGNINRGMRGLPDDFSGKDDEVTKEQNIEKNWTLGVNIDNTFEFVGVPIGDYVKTKAGLGIGMGIFYNNYKGMGFDIGLSTTASMSVHNAKQNFSGGPNISQRLSFNSQEGIGINQSFSLDAKIGREDQRQANAGVSFGQSFNTRSGLMQRSFGVSARVTDPQKNRKQQIYHDKGLGTSISSSIPVGDQSYVPQVSMPMNNLSFTSPVGLGAEAFWGSYLGTISISYSQQKLAKKKQNQPAYGYLFSDKARKDKHALYDVNREKDGEYTSEKPMLAVTNFTYDMYSVSGQGLGGIYRPYRADQGMVSDPLVENKSGGGNTGLDFSAGGYFKLGLKGGGNYSNTRSGKWDDDGASAQGKLKFRGKDEDAPQFEPYYFKAAGELTPINKDYYDEIGKDAPVNIDVTKDGKAKARCENSTPIKNSKFTKRQSRNQAIAVLNAEEASAFGMEGIKSCTLASDGKLTYETEPRIGGKRKKNHISEITTYRADGARYIYGIPVYNTHQKEVSFNASKKNGDPLEIDQINGTVKYTDGVNTAENDRGFDHYFSSTTLPGYAYSYLLTAVLSADYVDRTGNGPTDDDFGTYTKFNYKKYSSDYKWRTPYSKQSANFDDAFKPDPYDDKGHYIYGEKEIWYLQSITTKTMVAEFSLSKRNDSRGVKDEDGGTASANDVGQTTQRLDKITLYSKCERMDKKEAAIPLQEVHFVYDKNYSLCPFVPNNQGDTDNLKKGKLTLKEIYFTYQNSMKGKLSSYRFSYSDFDENYNHPYSLQSCDRWGNYKPNDPDFPNDEFPYAEQDKEKADKYAASWSLTKIELPSGGKIEVKYEADDYAFVQDKRAMQMMEVSGIGFDASHLTSTQLYENGVPNNCIKVKLPVHVDDKAEFINKYLRDNLNDKTLSSIYFRFLVDVIGRKAGDIDIETENEFVSGYAEITDECEMVGPKVNGKYAEAYIRLKNVSMEGGKDKDDANPIARTAWQMLRLNFSKALHPGSGKSNPDDRSLKSKIKQLGQGIVGLFSEIKQTKKGVNHFMCANNYGQTAILNGKSRIRLYSPNYSKIGGGSRVRQILVNDSWKSMADKNDGTNNAADASYGQEYSYTKVLEGSKTQTNSEGIIISSGVAEYEPIIGNEENPLRQPLAYKVENWMIPDNSNYVETPVGESFYPSASVGYSEIKIKSIQPGSGYIKHEFYTARDFPVVTEHTIVQKKPDKPKLRERLLKFSTIDALTVSQGHVIKLNNMHGQKKATWVYAEGEDRPISGQEFFYRTEKNNMHALDNSVTAINKKGKAQKITVGMESDFVADMRQHITESWSLDTEGEIDTSPTPAFGIPFPLPSIIPRYAYSSSKFKSATVTKVITKYGIMNKVVSYDLGSRVSVENTAYDAETGDVLLTKTENNFNDPVYSFTYPAHWTYDQMGMAYKNLGIKITGATLNEGRLTLSDEKHKRFFVRGDEVIVSGSNKRLWIKSINPVGEDLIVELMDIEGKEPADVNNVTLTIARSGRRNMQSTPVGTITLLENPITDDGDLNFDKIVAANATMFSDDWPDYCECGIDNGKMGKVFDPTIDGTKMGFVPNGNYYVQGAAGNWKAKRNYVFISERNSSKENRNLNIRKDGTYTQFDPFWKPNDGKDWSPNKSNWAWTTEVSKISAYGFEIENRDSLNNFSSALYGYSNTLAIAVAQNSQYKEIGVDNFEDYNCTHCGGTDENVDHWSFKNNAEKVVSTTSHTGKKSMQVKKHSKVSVGKKLKCIEKETVQPG